MNSSEISKELSGIIEAAGKEPDISAAFDRINLGIQWAQNNLEGDTQRAAIVGLNMSLPLVVHMSSMSGMGSLARQCLADIGGMG